MIGYEGKPVGNMGLFFSELTDSSPYPGIDIDFIKTNSKGISTLKYNLTKFGYTRIMVHSEEELMVDGGGENTAMYRGYFYKSFLKHRNKIFVKDNNVNIRSYFKNNGPKSTSFKVYYSIPNGVKYVKPVIRSYSLKSVSMKYNSKKRVYGLKIDKLRPNKDLYIKWSLPDKEGKYIINSTVKKSTSTKLNGKNISKEVKIK